jgi:predicted GH43/DUF377 family glycosyl hydrolase
MAEETGNLFQVKRLGTIMEPEAGNALEAEGVLNPALARAPDGQLYLFPRLVAKGNYSRIGIARVRFDGNGDPVGVERLGIALEPQESYERRGEGGGCEDPRITFVEALKCYVMTYTALSAAGPRIALAASEDLFHWTRVGLAAFEPCDGLSFDGVDNKDALLFPKLLPDSAGEPAIAMLHRPLFPGTRPHETAHEPEPRPVDIERESIWISYCSLPNLERDSPRFCRFHAHHRLASPVADWERLKIGGGTPPVITRHGWLLLYHGVSETANSDPGARRLRYAAGVLVLEREHPRNIRYRSAEPVITPETEHERFGIINNVVFPTACDQRLDLGQPNRLDVYYGMADQRIGAARLIMADHLPAQAKAHTDEGEV